MALAVSHGVMGADQPLPIHPLFTKENAVQQHIDDNHTPSVPYDVHHHLRPDNEELMALPATPTSEQRSEYAAQQVNDLPVTGSGHQSHIAPIFQRASGQRVAHSALQDAQARATELAEQKDDHSASLEEDPNRDRRKRQRKEKLKSHQPLASDPFSASKLPSQAQTTWSTELEGVSNPKIADQAGNDVRVNLGETGSESDPESYMPYALHSSSIINTTSPIALVDTKTSEETQNITMDGTLTPATESETQVQKTGRTAQKKTLKLSANGKLTSPSKTETSPTSNSQARGRKTALKKKNANLSKVVILRYSKKTGSFTASKIAEILAGGKKREVASLEAVVKKEKVSKVTHPFFANKSKTNPGPNADANETAKRQKDSAESQRPKKMTSTPIRPSRFADPYLVTDGHRGPTVSKNPDVLRPIWPPKDFGGQRMPSSSVKHPGDRIETLHNRKSKQAILDLPDEESILRQIPVHKPTTPSGAAPPGMLSLPSRKIMGGPECLNMIDSDHSFLGNGSNQRPTHPAISRLRTQTIQTRPAFDRGTFDVLPWTTKHAPISAQEVLQRGNEPVFLRNWIQSLTISAVESGGGRARPREIGKAKRKKKRPKKSGDELDDFIVSTDDEANALNVIEYSEDELSLTAGQNYKRSAFRNVGSRQCSHEVPKNAILLSGPHGCGKTAAVYAVSKELGFEIFEINAGSRRGAKDILDKVGDMTQNHLVQQGDSSQGSPDEQLAVDEASVQEEVASGRQATMGTFFKSKPASILPSKRRRPKHTADLGSQRAGKSQKQSLILIEEADILFDEDKSFWNAITTLANQSKRPIILTCSDEGLVPLEDLSLEAILRFDNAPEDLATEFLVTLAACEGHVISKDSCLQLYQHKGHDLRASITELSFYCQMAVGSSKAGLDWMLNRQKEAIMSCDGERLKITSLGTYTVDMSLLPRQFSPHNQQIDRTAWESLLLFTDDQLDLRMTDWIPHPPRTTNVSTPISSSGGDKVSELRRAIDFADYESAIDLLYSGPGVPGQPSPDASYPELTAKARMSYCEGYPLLETEELPKHDNTSSKLVAAMVALLNPSAPHDECSPREIILNQQIRSSKPIPGAIDRNYLLDVLSPLETSPPIFPPPTGRLALSLEGITTTIATEVAPYVRTIVSYDQRLEQQREELNSALSSQEGLTSSGGTQKKGRTTRASRAALEGGRKEETRRERWFHREMRQKMVMESAGLGWQEALIEEMNLWVMIGASQESGSGESIGEADEVVGMDTRVMG